MRFKILKFKILNNCTTFLSYSFTFLIFCNTYSFFFLDVYVLVLCRTHLIHIQIMDTRILVITIMDLTQCVFFIHNLVDHVVLDFIILSKTEPLYCFFYFLYDMFFIFVKDWFFLIFDVRVHLEDVYIIFFYLDIYF